MVKGTVKKFDANKGHGVVAPDGGGKDLIAFAADVSKSGLKGLTEGSKISFEVVTEKGKPVAKNIKLL